MKKKTKIVGLLMAAILLVVASILGTMAYLTAEDSVTNTFTVGNVAIKLDEAETNEQGVIQGDERVKGNKYHLIPGHTYSKDPMVTVLKGSEESYIRLQVSITNAKELDKIFDPGAIMTDLFAGYEPATWLYKGNTVSNNTRTYEFYFHEKVTAPLDSDLALKPIFKSLTVPSAITNEQLAMLKDMKITVVAHAIQADGFGDATTAWAAFDAQ